MTTHDVVDCMSQWKSEESNRVIADQNYTLFLHINFFGKNI